jgi:site-specific DNA-methyltransferase (adenine-specific)
MDLPINQIVEGDCLEVLKTLPDACVDLVIFDPPYNVGIKYASGVNDNIPWRKYGVWLLRRVREASRLLVSGGQMYLHMATRAVGRVPLPRRFICVPWIKTFSQIYGVNQPFNWGAWEPVFYWAKGKPGYISRANNAAMDGDYFLGPNAMGLQRNGQVPERWEHPCPKPLWLPQRMIERSCCSGGIVLDPCCGTGTSMVAAKMLGRRFIGIDISPEYCQIARERLKAVDTAVPVSEARGGQMSLFGGGHA